MIVVTIVVGLVGLGLMVFIHELGHFTAAKLLGVQVETFSLGWGTKMIGFTRKGTSYQIAWFPIGGFCKMKGEEGLRQAMADDRAEVPKEPGSLFAASAWKRILIYAAGPLFNVISALLIFTVIWWAGFKIYSFDNRLLLASNYTYETSSITEATKAGLLSGDRILSVDGRPVMNFDDLREEVALSPGRTLRLTVERDGRTLTVPVTPVLDKDTAQGRIGIYPFVLPVVDKMDAGSPASLSGLKKGDRITAVDGKPIAAAADFLQAMVPQKKLVVLTVERQGESAPVTLDLVPTYKDAAPTEQGIYWIINEYHSPRMSLPQAAARSLEETWMTAVTTVRGFGLLFRGINLSNAMAGPLRITYFLGASVTTGFRYGVGYGIKDFFELLSLLSVVLFLMNLLPLPALDGGQILITLIEIVRGKAVRPRTVGRIQFVAFSLLIILILFVSFSDILFLLKQ